MRRAAWSLPLLLVACRLDSAGSGDPGPALAEDAGTVVVDSDLAETVAFDTTPPEDADIDPPADVATDDTADAADAIESDVNPKCVGLPNPIYLASRNKCYWVVPPTAGGNVANNACAVTGSTDHITFVAADEQPTIAALAAREARLLWIGLRSTSGTEASAFVWMNGESTAFRNWAPSQPDKGDGGCVIVRLDGQWENRQCDEVRATICERD